MKYYVVALLDDTSNEEILETQRLVSKKFRANKNIPKPYIALEILDNPNIDKLTEITEKTLAPYKKFRVELTNSIFVSEECKTLNLKLNNRGYIKKIFYALNDMLKLHGFNVKDSDATILSLTLANFNYYPRDIKKKLADNQNLLSLNDSTLKISEFQIWKMPHNKHEIQIKDFELKVF
ncbi:hypothetical protein [uncultured Clostridium sp.]|uniref:hypothetical protein n=1 Tax=uncultured Clostridium sp. TaxID=59620 RepID=UPI002620CE68|nr:hypothetical protein [uncultured Clostridium sp.]